MIIMDDSTDQQRKKVNTQLNCPPILDTKEIEYEDWKKLTNRWTKVTNVEKNKHALLVSVKSLFGEALSLALSLDDENLESEDGIQYLFGELDKLYLKDKDSRGFNAW